MRVVFGRHFVTDIIFAGVITIAVVMALYRLLLDPLRRNDERMERGITRASRGIHRGLGTLLTGAGWTLSKAGAGLRQAGQHLHKRVACL
jgi:lipid A 4'-phosphatase